MENISRVPVGEGDDGGNLAAVGTDWDSLSDAENPIFNKEEPFEKKRNLLDKVEAIKDPRNKNLAMAMVGHAAKSRESGEEYGRIVDGLLLNYDENNGSMSDYIMMEKEAAGFGDHHNGYEIELGAARDDNLAYLRLTRLNLGNRVQEELNVEDKDSFRIGSYEFGPIFEDADDGGRRQAAIRLMAHDIIEKYGGAITPENSNEISADDRLNLSILSKSSCDFDGNVDRFMREVIDPRGEAYKFVEDSSNVISRCAKIAHEIEGIEDAHSTYIKALKRGKDILAKTPDINLI